MKIQCLQCRNVFCCDCQITDTEVLVGIFVGNGIGGPTTLTDASTGKAYRVQLPTTLLEYDIKLKRLPDNG